SSSAKSASYAVSTTILAPDRFISITERVVTCLASGDMVQELVQLALPEIPIGELRVRQLQPRFLYLHRVVPHDIKVDAARAPTLGPHPPHAPLDPEQGLE